MLLITLFLLLFQTQTQPDLGKTLPPPGIKISEADRAELTKDAAAFEAEIKAARQQLQGQPVYLDLFPDVLIYHKAVDWALKYDEFYDPKEVKAARELLKQGRARLHQIVSKNPSYLEQTGLVVRGYQSKIDGSVQPYGLVVPASYTPKTLSRYRLDVWLHGRGNRMTELSFIDQRSRQPGEFTPQDAFVLHPYGRYCNAFKFAGETDVFEALEHCKKHYRIDDKRLVVRGFSMGGAGCWHLAVHHPDKWCAAAPGAGFVETPEYTGAKLADVPPWEQKLWHLYNATDYAENLKQLPTIAYSGENDKQKQAADVMAREMKKFGMTLRHVIGPKMGHAYHPEAKREIERRIGLHTNDKPGYGSSIHTYDSFTTWTLRYADSADNIVIKGLEEHWKQSRITGYFDPSTRLERDKPHPIFTFDTTNISAFSVDVWDVQYAYTLSDKVKSLPAEIDGQRVQLHETKSDQRLTAHFRKLNGKWHVVDTLEDNTLRKKPGLQGPIDDAFMDSFLIVKPSGTSPHAKVNEWVDAEMNRAIDQWRKQFRGIPRVKFDKDVTEADINNHHLVLWGSTESNSVMKKIAEKMPVLWKGEKLTAHQKSYDAASTVPILIYPNPLNTNKYIALNSGHTFREESNRSNARQTPKLPDWAIIDITTPPNSYHPGKIVDAGFFGEQWEWK
jgi:predicted peptidase